MLTRRMQVQLIADRMAGQPGRYRVRAEQLSDPWRRIWVALEANRPGDEHRALLEALADWPDKSSVIGEVMQTLPGGRLGHFPTLEELARGLQPVTWVWDGWIPRGMLTLLGAVAGTGKSFLMLELARRIIHGMGWPDGQAVGRPGGNVIYVDAEAVPQLINERAELWEMDRGRLYLMLPEADDIIDFSQQRYRDRLVEMAAEIRPELIVVDSLSSISSRGENNVEDVRQMLAFLSQAAAEAQAGMVIIHHLRKMGAQMKLWEMSIDDFRGSGHITAMARSVMGLSVVQTGEETNRNGPRKLEVVKTNLGPYPEALGFELAPAHPRGVMLRWGAAPREYEPPTRLEQCREWLEITLREARHPMRPAEVIELGEAEGYSRGMIYRARDELGGRVSNSTGRKSPDNLWSWVGDKV